jgi:hypothetical protein
MILSHAGVVDQICFWCAAVPAALFCWNLFFFRKPPLPGANLPRLSVLIPARNEESNIGPAVESVLASRGVELELIVLDDASTDATVAIVNEFAAKDARVRCESAPPLRPGWAGKAHAAHALSGLARHDVFCFLDADVRVAPDALARMLTLLQKSGCELVSGFPEEITVTPMEWLLLPLIHFLLLSYLPLAGLRHTRLAAFGAGCGQFLMMTRKGYVETNGYAAVKTTMHDGIMLAKLFRQHHLRTDVADLTGLAFCRMYNSGSDVWQGLMKNATEGIAAPGRIVPFTALLLFGQVFPWVLLPFAMAAQNKPGIRTLAAACAFSLLPRALSIVRFRQKVIGAILHPVGITVFLSLQWSALFRKLRGTQATWKGRAFDVG